MEKFIIQELIHRINQNEDVALVTIVNAQGSSPRGTSNKLLNTKKTFYL
ncbi:XdhC family protein [Marinisporobacter balticus]|uniref:XdhC- CoxI domain-containing protein n=1 Tax=Marinisporobacter balticus TaxID=2018667 RepID=A0A4R2KX17_9FIRM|nr:XdhC family protein [Marinisporobacter balticus]TCO74778.1 hypothetical protein EV214_11140 [Marinisporobacter balticus]